LTPRRAAVGTRRGPLDCRFFVWMVSPPHQLFPQFSSKSSTKKLGPKETGSISRRMHQARIFFRRLIWVFVGRLVRIISPVHAIPTDSVPVIFPTHSFRSTCLQLALPQVPVREISGHPHISIVLRQVPQICGTEAMIIISLYLLHPSSFRSLQRRLICRWLPFTCSHRGPSPGSVASRPPLQPFIHKKNPSSP